MFSKWKSEISYIKRCVFSLVGNYLRPSNNSPQLIFNIISVVLMVIICKAKENGKTLPEFENFYCVLEK